MGKMASLGKMDKSINVVVYDYNISMSCLNGCEFTWSNVNYVVNKSTCFGALNFCSKIDLRLELIWVAFASKEKRFRLQHFIDVTW